MKQRERVAALRLALLLEEFSTQELERAVNAVSEHTPIPEPLRALLQARKDTAGRRQSRGRPDHMRESKAVRALREHHPERYQLLSSFEARLRAKELLSDAGQLSDFARDLGLDVSQRASRQDSISKLMARLVELPAQSASEIIASVSGDDPPDDGYRRLATYIHKGYDPGPASGPSGLPSQTRQTRD